MISVTLVPPLCIFCRTVHLSEVAWFAFGSTAELASRLPLDSEVALTPSSLFCLLFCLLSSKALLAMFFSG